MKKLWIMAALVCCVGAAGAAEKPVVRPGVGGPRADIPQEAAIRKLYSEFTAAWNKHDTVAMAAMWAPDGDHMEPDGRRAQGQKHVAALFAKEHKTVFKKTHLTLTIETVWFITATVAMIDGSYDLTGVVGVDGKQLPARKGHLTSILLKERGRWWIASSRAMIPVPLVWRAQ